MAASDIDGTSDRERIDALRADVQALRADVQVIGTDVQALTSLFEGFSTRTAEDATMHWQLSGESKVRLDHLDQMMQTLVDQSATQAQLLQTLIAQSAAQTAREPERRQ